jgi:hypothetical protein
MSHLFLYTVAIFSIAQNQSTLHIYSEHVYVFVNKHCNFLKLENHKKNQNLSSLNATNRCPIWLLLSTNWQLEITKHVIWHREYILLMIWQFCSWTKSSHRIKQNAVRCRNRLSGTKPIHAPFSPRSSWGHKAMCLISCTRARLLLVEVLVHGGGDDQQIHYSPLAS